MPSVTNVKHHLFTRAPVSRPFSRPGIAMFDQTPLFAPGDDMQVAANEEICQEVAAAGGVQLALRILETGEGVCSEARVPCLCSMKFFKYVRLPGHHSKSCMPCRPVGCKHCTPAVRTASPAGQQ